MSNSLLAKTHFDLLTDAIIVGPSDATSWDIEFEDGLTPDQIGQMLVTENLLATAWHRRWPESLAFVKQSDAWRKETSSDEALNLAASLHAFAAIKDAELLAELFDADELSWRQSYPFERRALRLTCAQVLELLGTWEYHSHEHLTWDRPNIELESISVAHSLVCSIREETISAAPGVPESSWDAYTDATAPVAD